MCDPPEGNGNRGVPYYWCILSSVFYLDIHGCCGYCPYTFNNTVMQVFKMTSFDTILAIFDSSEAALEGIN